ncbi:beta-carotene 3-hydroxylase 1, chloroplastic-like isoform X2 [Durio zibethinus]|uniref:beta-carotene 3-hydroxylase n=1 Tax=Durio zibethinus TaxID=66656 RepID=A0A6P5XZ64_DURZI|nr:beta-carotene 3-hydroxylase 1, chloroplastic-like isoform X2 [Durio zibethinus]
MATGSSVISSAVIYQLGRNTASTTKPNSIAVCFSVLTRETKLQGKGSHVLRKKNGFNLCMVMQQRRKETENEVDRSDTGKISESMKDYNHVTLSRVEEKLARKKLERTTYLLAAMLSSLGISSMAVMAVYYRFSWQMEGEEFPLLEMFSTFALSVGAAVGTEYWARWAHRALWHASLWHMHESHHRPRDGAFELNDVFAIINAAPAIALLSYGFCNRGLVSGLCFGAESRCLVWPTCSFMMGLFTVDFQWVPLQMFLIYGK